MGIDRREFLRMAAANERWMDTLFAKLSDPQIEELLRLLGQVRESIDSNPV